jgi:integrase
MLELMRKYWNRASEIVPMNIYFFPNALGNQILLSNVNRVFRTCWQNSHAQSYDKQPPRVYDFRHTFATRSIYNQMQNGTDINAFLPYLSAYMGHTHLSDTAYYIHLNPEFFPNAEFSEKNYFDDLLPEVEL